MRIVTSLLFGLFVAVGLDGQQWSRLGPEGGTVQSLGVGANGEVFLGAADGHIFASKDGANSWELRGRVGSRLDAVVTRLVGSEQSLFASVWYQQGDGGGVFQSRDAGHTWKLAGLQQEAVRALEIAPSNPQILVAGTLTGVFRSDDGGRNWARISPAGDQELRNIDSIAIDVREPEIIYAGTFHLPWKTTDGGKKWQPITAGVIDDSDVMSMHVDVTNPERLYMSACSGIYRSDNRGAQWTKMQGIPYSARRTQAIVQDPSNPQVLYAGTTEGLWITRDSGESWTRTTSKDWIINGVVVLKENNGGHERVVLGTEGEGVQVSDDAGVKFASANRGFAHLLVRQLVAEQDHPENLLMMFQRGGREIAQSRDGGKRWDPLPLTSLVKVKTSHINARNVQGMYASPWGWMVHLENQQFWIYEESRKGWREWRPRLAGSRLPANRDRSTRARRTRTRMQEGETIRAFSREAVFISTREGLFRCTLAAACSDIKAFRGEEPKMVWSAASGKQMAVIREGGKLGLSSDAGETAAWRELPVPAAQIVALDVQGEGLESRIYLCTGTGLFMSEDAGQHWKKSGTGLPPTQIDRWLRSPGLWVTTERDGGVYLSLDEGATWHRADRDSERSRFTGLIPIRPDVILGSSQSEGLLELTVDRGNTKGQARVP